jgi:Peptidase family S41
MLYQCRRFSRFAILVAGLLASLVVAVAAPADERAVENLAAFARVYGYVRFFHPSDEAATVDWDKVAILGAEAVRDAKDSAALRRALLQVFQPLAPNLRLCDPAEGLEEGPPAIVGERLIFWQHRGVRLSDQQGAYQSRRVIYEEGKGLNSPLFQSAPPPRTPLRKTLAPHLVLELPLVLPVGADRHAASGVAADLSALQTRLDALDLKKITPEDWRLRVAGVATVWNVFQHFHPYLDGIGVSWDEALRPALRRALGDRNADDYYATLSELVAKTHDGHGYVYGRLTKAGGLPVRVAMIEEQLVVMGVDEGVPLQPGDILTRIDGMPVLELMHERERYVSGSPHLCRLRALNQFGEGSVGSTALLEWQRNGAALQGEFIRPQDHHRGYFFNSIGEFRFPACAEVRPGVFYVNLQSCDADEFERKLPELAKARGVIFDWRSDGRNTGDKQIRSLEPSIDIIPHLIGQSIQYSPMRIPQITLPDRAGWTYLEIKSSVQPKAPRLSGQIVFIDVPGVVSAGETCMAMIANYRLAKLVGEPTAGCNGGVNFIPLPGGFRVMWTGMEVLKHDRSPLYTIGFVPDFPVARTLRAVKEGRDEYLEKAIEVIEQSTTPAEPPPAKKS